MNSKSLHEDRFEQPVSLHFNYPVIFTRGAFEVDNPVLAEVAKPASPTAKTLAFIDAGLAAAQPELTRQLEAYATHHDAPLCTAPVLLPGGEAVKDGWTHVNASIQLIEQHRLCRHSAVLAIGGGAFLDAVGLAASLVHRGVRLIRMPSTTLSQDDSGVGVKTGVNLAGQKNLIGTFAPPHAVINDLALLGTLPQAVMLDGIAEAFKVAIIKDAGFLQYLDAQACAINKGDAAAIEETVRRAALLHMDHIRTSGDPFEQGEARPLDFGHWAAHRLESLSNYEVRHGEAVAIGIALDSVYARIVGLLTDADCNVILGAISRCGLPLHHPLVDSRDADGEPILIEGLEQFREHLGGRLTITLPHGLGDRVEVNAINETAMRQALEELKTYADSRY